VGRRESKASARPSREPRRARQVAPVVIGLVVVLLTVAVLWLVPRPLGDLYVALAGGRDIFNGRLGGYDDWSFTTTDRVWFDQNWGTHVLYYVFYLAGGYNGLVVLKALLVAAMGVFVAGAAWREGVSPAATMVTTAGVLLACNGYVDMRPNLTTLVLVPLLLWLLYLARRRVRWFWVAVVLTGLWANMHGGFMFALGVMGLWVACRGLALLVGRGLRPALREGGLLAGGFVAAVLLAALANPFGPVNVTHPFTVASGDVWRTVDEWQPVFTAESVAFGSLWEFGIVLGVLGGLWTARLLVNLAVRRRPLEARHVAAAVFNITFAAVIAVRARSALLNFPPPSAEMSRLFQVAMVGAGLVGIATVGAIGHWLVSLAGSSGRRGRVKRPTAVEVERLVFDLVVTGVAVAMALSARRFIPLAILVMAPMLVAEVNWALPSRRRAWATAGVAGALVLAALPVIHELRLHYDPRNPLRPPGTFFDRMICITSFPPKAADFINANDISGRAFNEWRWEGYLHWRCPQLKLFVGGRAQQVYAAETLELWGRILHTDEAAELLDRLDVRVGVFPPEKLKYQGLIRRLLMEPGGRWAMVYYDERQAVVVDAGDPQMRALADRAARGELDYPDEASAAISRAMCLGSRAVSADVREIAAAFGRAIELRPFTSGYLGLLQIAREGRFPRAKAVEYFRQEYDRLGRMDYRRPNGLEILKCRRVTAEALGRLYQSMGNPQAAAKWMRAQAAVAQKIDEVGRSWR